MINIITFNILSPGATNPKFYPDIDENFLHSTYRFGKIKLLLTKYINDNYIICLQEVSKEWSEILNIFFEFHGYESFFSPFTNKTNRLGTAICYPKHLFNVINKNHYIIGTIIKKHMDVTSDEFIKEASKCTQVLLLVNLIHRETNKTFYVATYHMPCKYDKRTVMEAHLLFCMKTINEIVGDDCVIFTGDFNSKYNENEWRIIIKGEHITQNSKDIVKTYPHAAQCFSDSLENKETRDTTCYNQVNKEEFILDYIFYF